MNIGQGCGIRPAAAQARHGAAMTSRKSSSTGGSLGQLSDLIKEAGLQLKAPRPSAVPPPQNPPNTETPRAGDPETEPPRNDEEIFSAAMNGVERACWRHDPSPLSKPAPEHGTDPAEEERRLMQEAVDGDWPLSILDHPEYIEGWIGVAGKRYLPNLRNGLYSIQGQIDLHGLNRAEAQTAVEGFITRMSRLRPCCIKIIHGRGINSPTDRATLKEALQRLLSTRRMSHHVVAYASAPLKDGGVGAVYVLLHRR